MNLAPNIAIEAIMDSVQRGDKMDKYYCVSYAKISLDKEDGVELLGVFFGGISHTEQDAEVIAAECVNTTKGCTVIPSILVIKEDMDLLHTMDEACDRFKKKIFQMQEAYSIINRPHKKKSK
jgi:hypothetical protein